MFKNLSKLNERLANAMRFSIDDTTKLPNPFQRTLNDPNLSSILNSDITDGSNYSSSLTPFNFSVMKPTLN
jgi:hypothetical protein